MKQEAIIVTPHTTGADGEILPLARDLYDVFPWEDITGNPREGGTPSVDLFIIRAKVTGQELARIKSDDRFFVLSPGPGNRGSALTNWLSGKGASDHGVNNEDDEATAIEKLRGYFKRL